MLAPIAAANASLPMDESAWAMRDAMTCPELLPTADVAGA
jgi:hypothetical protein